MTDHSKGNSSSSEADEAAIASMGVVHGICIVVAQLVYNI